MALKRSELNAILNAFKDGDETLENSTKALLDKMHSEIDAEKDRYDSLQKEFDEYKSTNKDTGDADEWKSRFEKERDAFKAFKAEQAASADKAVRVDKYKALLKEAGVSDKRLDAILKVTDLNGIEFKDGDFTDRDKLTESIKSDWADFIVTKETNGADTPNPSANAGGGTYSSVADIMKIADRQQRRRAIKENPQLFTKKE